MRTNSLIIVLFLTVLTSYKSNSEEKKSVSIKEDVAFLADDKLEDR